MTEGKDSVQYRKRKKKNRKERKEKKRKEKKRKEKKKHCFLSAAILLFIGKIIIT